MGLEKLKPSTQRLLAALAPILALMTSIFLVIPKMMGVRSAGRLADAIRQQAMERQRQNLVESAASEGQHLAALPQTKDEQFVFLKQLDQIVSASHAQLVSYRPPSESGGHNVGQATSGEGRRGLLIPVTTEVTIAGSYSVLIVFFNALASSERLFTVETLQVKPDIYPRLTATFR
ncbi:MAG: hypothetical protein C4321_02880, partial [Chloroflexota bacterium]